MKGISDMDTLEMIYAFNRNLVKPKEKAAEILAALPINQIEKSTRLTRPTISRLKKNPKLLNGAQGATVQSLAYLYDEFVLALNHTIEK